MRLLSIDFDYFFAWHPITMDWSFGEQGVMGAMGPAIWQIRAATYLMRGLPLPQTTGLEQTFWSRVWLTPSATIRVADSHFQIGELPDEITHEVTAIVSIDAHHDAGYHGPPLPTHWDCSNWTIRYYLDRQVRTQVLYPQWRRAERIVRESPPPSPLGRWSVSRRYDHGRHLGTFDQVFVCRSGAWVPPWCDPAFFAFLAAAPRPIVAMPTYPTPREYDAATAEREGAQLRELITRARTSRLVTPA